MTVEEIKVRFSAEIDNFKKSMDNAKNIRCIK